MLKFKYLFFITLSGLSPLFGIAQPPAGAPAGSPPGFPAASPPAGAPGGPNGEPCWYAECIPIDGGLIFLLIGGVLMGVILLKKMKVRFNQQS